MGRLDLGRRDRNRWLGRFQTVAGAARSWWDKLRRLLGPAAKSRWAAGALLIVPGMLVVSFMGIRSEEQAAARLQRWVARVVERLGAGEGLLEPAREGAGGTGTGSARGEASARVGPPKVPYMSQWNFTEQSGRNNCGPAAAAMAIASYGREVTVHDAALVIRKGRDGIGNGLTDFEDETWDALFCRFGLSQRKVSDMESLRAEIDRGHPVIILVDNRQYMRVEDGREVPYPPRRGFESPHFVVVTRYELDAQGEIQNIYVHDSLAVKRLAGDARKLVEDPETGKDYRVPVDAFLRAVTLVKPKWYGTAVLPQPGLGCN